MLKNQSENYFLDDRALSDTYRLNIKNPVALKKNMMKLIGLWTNSRSKVISENYHSM
jgi:hypothetical protein